VNLVIVQGCTKTGIWQTQPLVDNRNVHNRLGWHEALRQAPRFVRFCA
jgi:hypothetical protein